MKYLRISIYVYSNYDTLNLVFEKLLYANILGFWAIPYFLWAIPYFLWAIPGDPWPLL